VKQYGKYYFGAIALFIIVAHGSQAGTAFSAGAKGVADVTKSLQGRG
jgi:hypothetical protein